MTFQPSPINILVVFGTRPEAIKMAPILAELDRRAGEGGVRYATCVTAQHREMLDQVLDLFGIETDYDLDLMTEAQSPARVAGLVLEKLESVLEVEQPDWIVVQGDTTTTAAASLAGYYFRAKVAHIEAGLRTHDKWQPFPEEVNRRVASVIADLHFAPTESAKRNLIEEGIPEDSIIVTGNTVIDSLQRIVLTPQPELVAELIRGAGEARKPPGHRVVLVTAHRRENFGRGLEGICTAIRKLAYSYPEIRIVFPMHMNPVARKPVVDTLSGVRNVTLIEQVDYISMVHLMNSSYMVVTDSGGIQEEAPALGKPVLVTRDVTERPEGVEAGAAKLVGTDVERVFDGVRTLLEDEAEYERMSRVINPYGDGRASIRIVRALLGEATDEFVPKV